MKKSILILPLVFVFLFASCTASVQLPLDPGVDETGPAVTETDEPAPEETQAPEPTQVPEPTPYVIVNGSSPIVYPAKMELSEEEQEIADRCYELFKQEYPLFADTPRELIREYVHDELESILKTAVITENTSKNNIGIGTRVRITNKENDKVIEGTLVGPSEADFAAGKIGADSPIGKAIMGKKSGAIVTVKAPKGDAKYKVEIIK